MTDRFNALTVVLEKEIRKDDAQAIISAIMQLKGVISVEGNVSDMNSHIAKQQAMYELQGKILEVFRSQK